MSLFDHVTPSQQAVELELVVKRLRGEKELETVSILVVEGIADETLFSPLCVHGKSQVFAAGSRGLVEQMLVYVQSHPIEGCECAFLVDCDSRGKTPALAQCDQLIVTQACDIEADMVALGVAARVARKFVPTEAAAVVSIDQAQSIGLSVSVVRRAAAAASVSMKRHHKQLRIKDLPDMVVGRWVEALPSPLEASLVIASELQWSEQQLSTVQSHIPQVDASFDHTCLGKDALDVLFYLLKVRGSGEIRGWNCDHFHREIFASIRSDDLPDWVAAQRLRSWESVPGRSLLMPRD